MHVYLTWEDVDVSVLLLHIGLVSRYANTLWSLSDALYRVCIMYKLRLAMTHEHIVLLEADMKHSLEVCYIGPLLLVSLHL